MNYFYAQINQDDVCYAVSSTHGVIVDPDLIQLNSFDESVLGKRWTGTTWEDVPPPPEPPVE